jgi:AMP-polyphosphate phosphotransferase
MPVTQNPSGESEIKNQISDLNQELGSLQRQAIQSKVPAIIVFEGADGAGKGYLMNRLLLSLDPRGFKVYSAHSPNDESIFRPYLWRFWIRTPERNRIRIFDRSWYRRLLDDRVNELVLKKQVPKIAKEVTDFERQLSIDGVVIIKIYLTISKEKQAMRFEKFATNPSTSWRVTKKDWKRHKLYDRYRKVADEMIQLTNAPGAPWKKIDSTDLKTATVEIMTLVRDQLKTALDKKRELKIPVKTPDLEWRANKKTRSCLDSVDLTLAIPPEEYRSKKKALQKRLYDLGHELYLSRRPVVLAFEGWDAAGKGGAIRRLAKGLDPRSYEVVPVAAPNKLELSHHYLWRFWNAFPKGGHFAIFDRTWYGRVTVERLEGFCSEAEWKRAYDEINEMEEHWSNHGTIVLKFWMHISKEEQLKRFQAREVTPHKEWKITEEDWRNREKWDAYKVAVEDMIDLTNKPNAPWVIVEGNNKHYARLKVLETTVKALESVL